jgi:hypothetical protein
MRHLKHGVSLVAVVIALLAASFGGTFSDFSASNSGISVESTDSGTSGDLDLGSARGLGLHW